MASEARPFSKSAPTILSMFMNKAKTLPMPLFSPVIVHVTWVPLPDGVNVKLVGFTALKGLVNSRRILMLAGSSVSTISIVPEPALRFPLQAYLAPTPDSLPE